MRFFRGIAFQIWLPYAIVFLVLLAVVALYYPSRQEDVFIDQKQKELKEMARSISVGIELSLDAGNFAGLQKTLRYFAGSDQDVSVMVFSGTDSLVSETIAYFPPKADTSRLISASNDYIRVAHPFRSASLQGSVDVFFPRKVMNELLWALNFPVYSLLGGAFIVTALLFYFVALRVSKPISEITQYASGLIVEKSFQPVHAASENEIGILRNSLISLKESLDFKNEQNKQLTEGLETEVRNRTRELSLTVEKLSQAQSSARIGDFNFNRGNSWFTSSPVLPEILGMEAGDKILLKDFLELLVPAVQQQVRSFLMEAPPDDNTFSLDVRLNDKNRWIAIVGKWITDVSSGQPVINGTIQDITERKLAEAEVQKLSLVARLSTNGIVITDAQQRIVWVNQSTEQLTGYTLAEMRGKSPSMFQFEETSAETRVAIKNHLDEAKPIRTEILNRAKDGRKYWLELHIQPFFDDYGSVDGYLAIEVDITDRKRYEEDLKQALTQEKELSGMKSRFITMTSHEFRTPLTTIQANLELMSFHFQKNEQVVDPKIDRYVGRITKEVGRLTSLMNDILLLGRIDSGKIEFKPLMVSLNDLVVEIIENQQFIASDSRRIELEVSGEPKQLLLDPTIANHIFFNVFSNAIKYSPGAPAPKCHLHYAADTVVISVRDYGVGIPKADLPHVFESFHRGSNVSTIQGTGLGLQITKQFVELHGGHISLTSTEGEGTEVNVTFPCKGPERN